MVKNADWTFEFHFFMIIPINLVIHLWFLDWLGKLFNEELINLN